MADENRKKLVLLHSNDMHGDFLAEQVDNKLVGGVARLSGYINKVKAEEPNTLYCIAGDMFRGSIIDAEFMGLSTVEIMNMLSPDVVTIGNHETDYGLSHLLFLEKCANFPIINANMHIKLNHRRLFEPYKIIYVDGMKVLFIGILTEEVLSQTRNDGMIGTLVDIVEAANEIGNICNTYNPIDIDFTVLLTHIGFEEDKKLAALLDPSWGVDVIIGGHSHTLLDEPAIVNGIPIVQAGTGTDQIGRFDIIVDTDNNCIDSFTWETIPINDNTCPIDKEMERLILNYKNQTDEKYNRVITRFNKTMTHPIREQETELGDLYSDILQECLGLDIMLLGSGSIRTEKMEPIVTLQQLKENYPYGASIHMVMVTGEQLKRMMLYMLRDEVWEGVHSEFYQVSKGMRMVYEKATHSFKEFSFNNKEIKNTDMLRIGLQKFHYLNLKDGLNIDPEEILANAEERIVATNDADILMEYLTNNQHLTRNIEGRIVIL